VNFAGSAFQRCGFIECFSRAGLLGSRNKADIMTVANESRVLRGEIASLI